MRYVQIVEPADNCMFDVFAATPEEFSLIFPGQPAQDIEFAEDFYERLGDDRAKELLSHLWVRRQDKRLVPGIQGTLFFQYPERRAYFPTRSFDTAIPLVD